MSNIRHFRELRVYQNAMNAAMQIFEITKSFPTEERYSMTDQMRRSSRRKGGRRMSATVHINKALGQDRHVPAQAEIGVVTLEKIGNKGYVTKQ